MINFENRYDEYAYRISYRELDPSVTALEEGQWITLENGKAKISDGTKKSFLCLTSIRAGRDQLSGVPVKKVSYLHGTFQLSVTNFDLTETYGDLTPLVVNATGELTPFVEGTHKEHLIAAYSTEAPANGVLRICSAN